MFVLFESLCRKYRKFFWESSVCVFPFLLQKTYTITSMLCLLLIAQNISDAKQENVLLINTGDIVSSNEILMRHLCPENETKGTYKYSKKAVYHTLQKTSPNNFP